MGEDAGRLLSDIGRQPGEEEEEEETERIRGCEQRRNGG